jgi:hypothetical protein
VETALLRDEGMLTDPDFFRLVDFALRLPGCWWIRRSEDYAGGGAVVLTRAGRSAIATPRFRFFQQEQGIIVETCEGRWRRRRSVFPTIDDALDHIFKQANRTHLSHETTCILQS